MEKKLKNVSKGEEEKKAEKEDVNLLKLEEEENFS
jgi:hypothetical protein